MSGGAGGRAGVIPAEAREMVASLKEIVNCPEAEIYAVLRECGMDPDEAVQRLLSQDTFHEVKSKREKKKEVKEIPDNRSRTMINSSTRGVRGGADCGGRINPPQFSSNDSGVGRGKPTHKKENLENVVSASNLGSTTSAGSLNKRPTTINDSSSMENIQTIGVTDGVSFPAQSSSGLQNSRFGIPGHRSMADVVKMGRPQGKPPIIPAVSDDMYQTLTNTPISTIPPFSGPHLSVLPSESNQESHSPQNSVEIEGTLPEQHTSVDQQFSSNDWVLVDGSPAATVLSTQDSSGTSGLYLETSTLPDGINLHINPCLGEVQEFEADAIDESLPPETTRSFSVSESQVQLNALGDKSHMVDDSMNLASHHSHQHGFEHYEVEDSNDKISSVAANLHQLGLQEDVAGPSAEGNYAVIIPHHLQVTNADCSHLSFGSFGTGISAAFAGSLSSKTVGTKLDVAPVANDTSSAEKSDARSPEYYDNGQLRSAINENVNSATSTATRDFDLSPDSQSQIIRNDLLDSANGLQYSFTSVSSYPLANTTESNAAEDSYPNSDPQLQNLAPFPSLMPPSSNVLASNSLASTLQPVQDFDHRLSHLLTTESVPTKYGASMSLISGQKGPIPEAVKSGVLSSPQQTQQSLPSTSIPSGHALPQHFPAHAYSQPALSLGHFSNTMSYPYLPQSYAYMPSAAYQQTYTSNGAFHQSPTALPNIGMKYTLPQYKSSVSVSNLPQSASVASAYGGFGSSSSIPGGLNLNPSTASGNTAIGFDEALSSQYKEVNHHVHQQSENPAMWAYGAGTRTMSGLPTNAFYNFLEHSQLSGYRESQQLSPPGNLSYTNLYPSHSQARISQEHQQNPGEGNLSNHQGQRSQQSHHQLWQRY